MDDLKKLKRIAIDLLSRREHSRQELMRKLQKHSESLELCQSIVDDLVSQGLQSDTRFAENYLYYRAKRGFGPIRIAMELAERGVAAEIIENQLEMFNEDWLILAKNVQYKRFGGNMPSDYLKRSQQMRFLQYRGFSSEMIRQVFL